MAGTSIADHVGKMYITVCSVLLTSLGQAACEKDFKVICDNEVLMQ